MGVTDVVNKVAVELLECGILENQGGQTIIRNREKEKRLVIDFGNLNKQTCQAPQLNKPI